MIKTLTNYFSIIQLSYVNIQSRNKNSQRARRDIQGVAKEIRRCCWDAHQ